MNFTKLFKFLAAVLFATLAFSVWAQTGNRYALVIGNNNYKNGITTLSTPVSDANDVSASLKTLGYETILKTNKTIAELDDAIDQFLIKLDSNRESEGFFWFAGHGVNVANKHYLLAVDVDPRNDNSIIRGSYSVDKLVEGFDRIKNKANLLVIDACRNDFIPGSRTISGRGLAVVASDSVVGNVIAYSTRAGQTADDGKPGDRNSPFAAAFLNNIKTAKSFDNLFIQIANDTRTRTNGRQLPYKIGYFTIEDYAIAPVSKAAQGVQPTIAPISTAQSSNLGITWTTVDGNRVLGVIRTIIYGNSRFIAVGFDNYLQGKIAYSTNGIDWIAVNDTSFGLANIGSIAYGDGTFVAGAGGGFVGNSQGNGKLAYSTDGIKWNAVNNNPFGETSIRDIAYGNNKFVAVGDSGKMAYSINGIHWNSIENNSFGTLPIMGITYGGGKFVAVGYSGHIAYSTDGIKWIKIENHPLNNHLTIDNIAFGNGIYLATNSDSVGGSSVNGLKGKMIYSTDGIHWNEVNDDILGAARINNIVFGDNRFLAGYRYANEDYKMAYSLDGIKWVAITGNILKDAPFSICYGNGKFIAISNGGKIFISPAN